MENNLLRKLIVSLHKVDGIKFGSFTLKSGLISPVYFDLRVIISHPEIMKSITELVSEEINSKEFKDEFDILCGVPYTALPIASLLSVQHGIPMVIKRKEQKSYGTGKLIEGLYIPGKSRCLILEDVITTGSSIIETAESLREHGIKVDSAIVILDRSQGAQINLTSNGISKVKALITMPELLQVLLQERLITCEQKNQVESFLQDNQLYDSTSNEFQVSLESKIISKIVSPIGSKLVQLMGRKKSNLCLSIDLEDWKDALEAVDLLGPKLCLVKTHIDSLGLKGWRVIEEFTDKLQALSKKHDFLIMEDRKFADIGSTVAKQLVSKPFKISKWADLVTAHGISGPGILQAIQNVSNEKGIGLGVVLIAEMSSEGNLAVGLPGYKEAIGKMTHGFESVVTGFVSQSMVKAGNKEGVYFVQFTPGVKLEAQAKGDGLGQQYSSVQDAILKRGADVIIVGRGMLNQEKHKWLEIAEEYRKMGWSAFVQKVQNL